MSDPVRMVTLPLGHGVVIRMLPEDWELMRKDRNHITVLEEWSMDFQERLRWMKEFP